MENNTPQGTDGSSQQGGQNQPGVSTTGSDMKSDVKGLINQLEVLLDEYMVKKAPFQIPVKGKELLAKIVPYIIIIAAVVAIPAILAALGLSAVFAPIAALGGHVWGFGVMISLVFSIAALVVELRAVPGLFKRTKSAWRLVFYATIISLIGSLISFNIVGGLIGAVIGWYLLFQIKDMYKN